MNFIAKYLLCVKDELKIIYLSYYGTYLGDQ